MDVITKTFPVFDCDAHIDDPLAIWDYIPEAKRALMRECYWADEHGAVLNGSTPALRGGTRQGGFSGITIAGPQMNKRIIRKLRTIAPGLSEDQQDYLDHEGARDPRARLRDMDLMGIDQVLVIGTMINSNVPFIVNPDGAKVFCEAYNNWLLDWCAAEPTRLFGAAILPLQRADLAAAELRRVAESGYRVALIRPIDAQGGYPSFPNNPTRADARTPSVVHAVTRDGAGSSMDLVFKTFEETGLCCAMHTFPCPSMWGLHVSDDLLASPGDLLPRTGLSSNTLSFVFEAQVWLGQVLLSGFLDRYPRLKMLVFESNSQWLPSLLEACDRYFKLYRNERQLPAERLPSEAFFEQCALSFESDEVPTFRRWPHFENIGIWASDAYHHDGSDAWSAIREMRTLGVPDDVQVKLMGANACRIYGIEPKLVVTEEPAPLERPEWFPTNDPQFEEWAELVKYPRRNAARLAELDDRRTTDA